MPGMPIRLTTTNPGAVPVYEDASNGGALSVTLQQNNLGAMPVREVPFGTGGAVPIIYGGYNPVLPVPPPDPVQTVDTLDDMLSLDPATPVGTLVNVTATGLTYELQSPSATVAGVSLLGSPAADPNALYDINGQVQGRNNYEKLGMEVLKIQWTPDIQANFSIGPSAPGWVVFIEGDASYFYSTDDVATPDLAEDWFDVTDTPVALTVSTFMQGELDAGVTVVGGQSEDDIYPASTPANGFNSYVQLGGEQFLAIQFNGTVWSSTSSASSDATAFPWQADWSGASPAISVTRNDVASLANWLAQ